MRSVIVMAVVLASCSTTAPAPTVVTTSAPVATAPSSTVPESTSTTGAVSTTTLVGPDCPAAPYRIGRLPDRVAGAQVPAENIAFDEFTSVAGTHSTIWLDGSGGLVMALVRGTLPPEEWPGDKGEVFIDGARAVAGMFGDGSWVIAWFEEPGARCDLYTMVFYPPVTPGEVKATLESMDRTAG